MRVRTVNIHDVSYEERVAVEVFGEFATLTIGAPDTGGAVVMFARSAMAVMALGSRIVEAASEAVLAETRATAEKTVGA